MKRLVILGVIFLNTLLLFGQEQPPSYIATYNEKANFSIALSQEGATEVFDLIKETFKLPSSFSFHSVSIDDDDPYTIDSISYLIFNAISEEDEEKGAYSIGFALKKELIDGDVRYILEPTEETAAKSWSCKKNIDCSQCSPKRKWFLGSVVGCKCNDCIFETSGSGFGWGNIVTILVAVIGIIT